MSRVDRNALVEGLNKLGLQPTETMVDQLVQFGSLLLRWNKVYNLTAIRNEYDVLTHHLLDSATLVPFVEKMKPEAKKVLDVGSGGGLPAIPLAILRPDLSVTAVDAVAKKTAFLTQAGIELGLKNFKAVHARVEKMNGSYDIISSRAFASLEDFTDWTQALLADDGYWLAMKGNIPNDELKSLEKAVKVQEIFPLHVPDLEEERHLVVMTKS